LNTKGLGANEINNGFFELQFNNDGVYLTVYPAVGKGKRVELNEVIEKLKKKQVDDYDSSLVQLAVSNADKIPIRIAEPQEEKKLNSTISVMITPDKMKAFVTITPPEGGRMVTIEEILIALKENGVIYGIKKAVLNEIIEYPVFNEMLCVAEGTAPVNGENGKVEFHFNLDKNYKPAIMEDGTVDFRSLNLIENVKAGQKLCSLVPPKKGTNGRTVLGTDIPAQDGKIVPLPKGRNVQVSDDGQYLTASIDGQVNYTDGKVSVFSTYEVQADVDNSTGNIKFVGNVRINGNVLSGFTVEAGGIIEVWGVVEGAVLKAEGDIILRRGMQGMNKGMLISGGSIVAKFIENSSASARLDIKSEAIMHSNIKCGNKLELGGRKGLLVGGSCKVGKEIEAKVIGSNLAATATDIEVGVDPTLRERYKELKKEIAVVEENIKKAEQAIKLLKKLQGAGALPPEKKEILDKSIRTRLFLTSRAKDIKDELVELELNLQQDAAGKVKCHNYIYPGTKVAIGTCLMYVRETLQHCTLYRDGADVRVGPLA
jgi:uncharacterized protein (DUF342 family)